MNACLPTLRGAMDFRLTWLASVALLVLAGCAQGPNFETPAAPNTPTSAQGLTQYTEAKQLTSTVAVPGLQGESQQLVPADSANHLKTQWWTLFESPALDELLQQALAHNPNLEATRANLKQAEESYTALYGSLALPNVGLSLQGGRERTSYLQTEYPSVDTNLYNASVNVSYTVDLFGANKRNLEAQLASVDYQRFQLEAAKLALTANVVTTAIREASLRDQLQTTRELLRLQTEQLQVLEQQYQIGGVGLNPVLSQRALVANTRAQLPPLEKALAQARHQLAVYVGQLPSEAGLPQLDLARLRLPQKIPLTMGSDLVRQRPDIRASEALWHQASAQVGVATANLYPQINLTASLGATALTPAELLVGKWGFWNLMGGLTQPIFNGGALSAKKRGAEAAFEAAGEQYRGTVLQAFQNVADSLTALSHDAQALQAQVEAESAAQQLLDLSQAQYQVGGLSYLNLLDAQRNYQQARIAVVSARATRLADTAALFQSLGGGWWQP